MNCKYGIKKLLNFLALFILFVSCKNNEIINNYQFLNELEGDSLADPSNYTCVPDVERIIRAHEISPLYIPDLNYDSIFNIYHKSNAVDYIIKRSKEVDILILNESHHMPSHRSFATDLLKKLKKNGYKYIGIEALSNIRQFKSPDYPYQDLGYYFKDPNFGNFVREAIQLGFELFPYETTTEASDKYREIEQAENIYSFMKNHQDGKYFIYCGYDHNLEGDLESEWEKAMAGRLEDLTKENALTINQTLFNNIKCDYTLTAPFVLLEADSISTFKFSQSNDVFVFHPKVNSKFNRLEWKKKANNQWLKVDFLPNEISYPLLLFVFYNKIEYENNSIPYDIIEINNGENENWLVVPKTDYIILGRKQNGEIIIFKE